MASLHKLFYELSSHFSKSCWPLSTRRERDIRPQGSLHCSLCSGSWTALDSGLLPGASRCLATPLDSALPAAHAPPTETAADVFLRVKRETRGGQTLSEETDTFGRERVTPRQWKCAHMSIKLHTLPCEYTENSPDLTSAHCKFKCKCLNLMKAAGCEHLKKLWRWCKAHQMFSIYLLGI